MPQAIRIRTHYKIDCTVDVQLTTQSILSTVRWPLVSRVDRIDRIGPTVDAVDSVDFTLCVRGLSEPVKLRVQYVHV